MSNLFLDTKYIHEISPRLQRFHKTDTDKYAFRCPICGDSKKDKSKTRGNFQVYKGQVFFGCYNGCDSMPFNAFLKQFDQEAYDRYILESFGRSKRETKSETKCNIESSVPTFTSKVSDDVLDKLINVATLPSGHPARMYVENRGITQLDRLYYTPLFKKFCNKVKKNTFENDKYDTPRLIIPFMDKEGKVFAFQGRSFSPNAKAKYITIKLDEDMPKLFGLDKLDQTKPILLLEGPINTLFLNNAIGGAGANLESYADMLDDPILVFDNDSRNEEIVRLVKKSIDNGRRVVLWDNTFGSTEDVNDIANKYDMSKEKLTKYLISNSYRGLEAELEFGRWKKI